MSEIKLTPWITCKDGPWYPSMRHGGYAAYRIWQLFDGMRWLQRHEWRRADGSEEMEDWIVGISGWTPSAEAASPEQRASAFKEALAVLS